MFFSFVLIGEDSVTQVEECVTNRPIWFIYSGMGSQWASMGRDLIKIDVFRKTFDECAKVMEPYNIDLYHIVTTDDRSIFDSALNTFPAICAIQLGLTDVLFSFGISPDGIAGHSMGEVGKIFKSSDLLNCNLRVNDE